MGGFDGREGDDDLNGVVCGFFSLLIELMIWSGDGWILR